VTLRLSYLLLAVWAVVAPVTPACAATISVRVTVRNLGPAGGAFFTPVWVGFHDGSFDIYDSGSPASTALERLAEDGETMPIASAFLASGAGTVEGTILGPMIPQIGPGESTSMIFSLDSASATSRYFSYASMIIPSNDAFIANGNPTFFPVFDMTGGFLGGSFIVSGGMVLDAGTEVNDEIPMNTAFFGQTMPNTGTTENGVVAIHPGFLPPGSGGILDSPMFPNANFKAAGYQVAEIRVEAIPEPATFGLAGAALAVAMVAGRIRRKQVAQWRR
jgi:hypothetical protein